MWGSSLISHIFKVHIRTIKYGQFLRHENSNLLTNSNLFSAASSRIIEVKIKNKRNLMALC